MTAIVQTQPAPPARAVTRSGGIPGRLIKSELLKLSTTNVWWIVAICMLAATALALFINGAIATNQINNALYPPDFGVAAPPGTPGGVTQAELDQMRADWIESHPLQPALENAAASIFTSGQLLGLMLVMFLGTLIVTNEFFHQTATTTFLATPKRTRVILAKLGAAVSLGAIAWFVTTLVNLGVGAMIFAGLDQPTSLDVWSVQRAIFVNLPAYAIWAIFGVGLGALIRSQIGATIVGIVVYFLGTYVAQIAFFAIHELWIKEDWVLKAQIALPAIASATMVSAHPLELGWSSERQEVIYGPQWWVGALILVSYGVLAGAIGTLIMRKRDIS